MIGHHYITIHIYVQDLWITVMSLETTLEFIHRGEGQFILLSLDLHDKLVETIVEGVMRYRVHYITPELEVISFCVFNILSDLYRDFTQGSNSIGLNEYTEKFERNKIGEYIEYKGHVHHFYKLLSKEIELAKELQ